MTCLRAACNLPIKHQAVAERWTPTSVSMELVVCEIELQSSNLQSFFFNELATWANVLINGLGLKFKAITFFHISHTYAVEISSFYPNFCSRKRHLAKMKQFSTLSEMSSQ